MVSENKPTIVTQQLHILLMRNILVYRLAVRVMQDNYGGRACNDKKCSILKLYFVVENILHYCSL